MSEPSESTASARLNRASNLIRVPTVQGRVMFGRTVPFPQRTRGLAIALTQETW